MAVPDRWLQYKKIGRIHSTRFIAFKVPLKEEFLRGLPPHERFTPNHILLKHPKLKLVIDLTFTTKYYDKESFQRNGVEYKKIMCQGQIIPAEGNYKKFQEVVDTFLEKHPDDGLIGVHCTHGVNRTGYLIVRYMIERMGYTPHRALAVFLQSRGHAIERTPYLADLLGRGKNDNFHQIMPGDDLSRMFKRCRSAINVNDPTLKKIAQEINFAEMLLLQYLKEMTSSNSAAVSSQSLALDHLSQLIIRELEYLRKVKNSEVIDVSGSFVTFRGDDGEFLVTDVPEEELQRNFHPLFSLGNIKPRFAKPVSSSESFAMPSPSTESIYYDACYDLPAPQSSTLCSGSSDLGRSIHGLLSYIFASTIGKMDAANKPKC